MPGFRAANKLLNKYEQERNYRIHKQKMANAKTTINNKSPKKYPHLIVKLKQIQLEEERQAEVDHENKVLLHKMTNIMKNRPSVDYWNEYEPRSLNYNAREKNLREIQMENIGIARRLEKARPVYDLTEFETDYQHKKYLQMIWNDQIKDYVTVTPRHLKYREMRRNMGDEDYDDDESIEVESGHVVYKHDKLPPLADSKSKQDVRLPPKGEGKSVKSDSYGEKLPKIDQNKQRGKVKKYYSKNSFVHKSRYTPKSKLKLPNFEKIEEEKETSNDYDKNNNEVRVPKHGKIGENNKLIKKSKKSGETTPSLQERADIPDDNAEHSVYSPYQESNDGLFTNRSQQSDRSNNENPSTDRSQAKFLRLTVLNHKDEAERSTENEIETDTKVKGNGKVSNKSEVMDFFPNSDIIEFDDFYDSDHGDDELDNHITPENETLRNKGNQVVDDETPQNTEEKSFTADENSNIAESEETVVISGRATRRQNSRISVFSFTHVEVSHRDHSKENGVIVQNNVHFKKPHIVIQNDDEKDYRNMPPSEKNQSDENTDDKKGYIEDVNDMDLVSNKSRSNSDYSDGDFSQSLDRENTKSRDDIILVKGSESQIDLITSLDQKKTKLHSRNSMEQWSELETNDIQYEGEINSYSRDNHLLGRIDTDFRDNSSQRVMNTDLREDQSQPQIKADLKDDQSQNEEDVASRDSQFQREIIPLDLKDSQSQMEILADFKDDQSPQELDDHSRDSKHLMADSGEKTPMAQYCENENFNNIEDKNSGLGNSRANSQEYISKLGNVSNTKINSDNHDIRVLAENNILESKSTNPDWKARESESVEQSHSEGSNKQSSNEMYSHTYSVESENQNSKHSLDNKASIFAEDEMTTITLCDSMDRNDEKKAMNVTSDKEVQSSAKENECSSNTSRKQTTKDDDTNYKKSVDVNVASHKVVRSSAKDNGNFSSATKQEAVKDKKHLSSPANEKQTHDNKIHLKSVVNGIIPFSITKKQTAKDEKHGSSHLNEKQTQDNKIHLKSVVHGIIPFSTTKKQTAKDGKHWSSPANEKRTHDNKIHLKSVVNGIIPFSTTKKQKAKDEKHWSSHANEKQTHDSKIHLKSVVNGIIPFRTTKKQTEKDYNHHRSQANEKYPQSNKTRMKDIVNGIIIPSSILKAEIQYQARKSEERKKQKKATEKDKHPTRHKGEEGSENGSESRKDRPKDTQLDQDCVALFKAAKQLAKPEEVFIHHLVRRTQKQRMSIKNRFPQLYDLNLVEELKTGLGKDWNLVIDGLLSDRSGSSSKSLHNAIEKKDYCSVVELLYSCDNAALADLNTSYKKEYSVSIESDIQEKTEDPERTLLLLLQRGDKDESTSVNEIEAEADADDLNESGDGRWTSESGKFLKLLATKSYSHIKVVLSVYRVLAGGRELTDDVKSECPKKYAEALCTLINCMRAPDNLYADKIYKHHLASDPVLVNILISRSEIDMPSIKRAYRKRYDADLVEDLRYRNNHPTINVLIELTNRNPPMQSKGKFQGKRLSGVTAHSPVKRQPVKRPDNKNKQLDTESIHNNPLAQPSQRPMADATQEKKEHEKVKEKEKQENVEQKTQRKNISGTVKPSVGFNSDNDCEKLKKAMSGLGTDENVIIEIIPHRSNGQRQQLKKKYQEKYKKDLPSELESELTGDCEEIVLALMMTPTEYDAHCLHEAVDGLGTNEATLIGILCTRDAKEKKAIIEHYKKTYKSDLEKDIASDTSGDFQNMLLALCKGERDQSTTVNQKEAEQDAKKLYKDGQIAIDVKDETFIDILVKKNHAQVKATFKEYQKLTGYDIYTGITSAMLGDAEDGYVALAKAIQDPIEFYADRLMTCFGGLGTNDNMLIRICVSRSEIDLGDIMVCYEKLAKKSLADSIKKECSGDYKRLLLAVIGVE